MAAPISAHVGEWLEAMWYPMVDLLLVRVGFGVGLANTLGDDFRIAFFVAGILAILTLHAS